MKVVKFLSVALMALTLFSCSRDEAVTPGIGEPGEPAIVTVKLTGKGDQPMSKALGAVTDSEDTKIHDFIVFIFRDNGVLDCPPAYATNAGNASEIVAKIDATTAGTKAYVVANTGPLEGGMFQDVSDLSSLLAVKGDLMAAGQPTQTKEKLWMSGMGDIQSGRATVALGFVAAKIQLIIKNKRTLTPRPDNGGPASYEDKFVGLYNAGKHGVFFAADPDAKMNQTAFYSAGQHYWIHQGQQPQNIEVVGALRDDVVGGPHLGENPEGAVFNHFYTFGNNGENRPTLILLFTELPYSAGTSESLFPVRFSKLDVGHGIEPGNSYVVTLTLSGELNDGSGGGVYNPELEQSKVDVSMTVAPWNPVIINKEIK